MHRRGGNLRSRLVHSLRSFFMSSVPFESFHAPVKEPFKLSKMKPNWMDWQFVWSCLSRPASQKGRHFTLFLIVQTSYIGLIVWLVAHDHKPWCANEHFLRAAGCVSSIIGQRQRRRMPCQSMAFTPCRVWGWNCLLGSNLTKRFRMFPDWLSHVFETSPA